MPKLSGNPPEASAISLPLFIHGEADDYGLRPEPWRVLCHLSRRAGSGKAFAGVPSMAAVCRLKPKTLRKCIAELERLGIIAVDRTPGEKSFYRINPLNQWQPLAPDNPTPEGTHVPKQVGSRAVKGPWDPSPEGTHEVTPNEVTPLKLLQKEARAPKSRSKTSSEITEEFLKELKADPAYSWIDLQTELSKASRWCAENRRQLTRRFFTNWLNRIQKPLTAAAVPQLKKDFSAWNKKP